MTNEQTYLFLNQYRARLYAAIQEGEALTTDENKAIRKAHRQSWCLTALCSEENNPTHYVDRKYTPSLEPLYDLLDSVDEDLKLLQKGIENAQPLEKTA